jgi:hypothetical protein
MAANVGERFASALLARDWDGVKAILDPAVEFRGLTPGRVWEARTADDLVEQVLSQWYECQDDAYEVLDIATGQVEDRQRVVYRYRLRDPDGEYVAEQTACFDADAGRITKLRILCSGPVPVGGQLLEPRTS